MLKKFYFLSLFFIVSFNFYSFSGPLLSDLEQKDKSFSFNIGNSVFYFPAEVLFVGAKEEIENNKFALAGMKKDYRNRLKLLKRSELKEYSFKSLAPKTVTLNNKENQDNPIYGSAIEHLVLLGRRPLVITKKEKSTIYVVDDALSPDTGIINVFSADNIKDSSEKESPEILSLTTSAPSLLEPPADLYTQRYIFAAVANPEGNFDGNGSGIALLSLEFTDNKDNKTDLENDNSLEDNSENSEQAFQFSYYNAQTGEKDKNKAVEINKSLDAIKIGSEVSSIGKVVDMHFDDYLKRFYIAIDAESGPESTDGAKAIIVGGIKSADNYQIILNSIAPNEIFNDDKKIVGTRGAHSKVQIHKVRTLNSTTHLNYLVVVGGNSSNNTNTKRQVYALPIVDNLNSPFFGGLANVNLEPSDNYGIFRPFSFLGRGFTEHAQIPEDVYDTDSVEAKVGGDELLPNNITDIHVIKDTIFVSTNKDGNSNQAGIFYSQAIFNESGKISAWTPWQRCAGKTMGVESFAFDPFACEFWYVQNKNGQTNDVFKTDWSLGKTDFESSISSIFPKSTGGVHGIFDFAANSPGFSQDLGFRTSILALAGNNKVLFLQTGHDNSSNSSNNSNIFTPENISLNSLNVQYKTNIGHTRAVSLATDTNSIYGWFVAGGTNGLEILAKPNGEGWDANTGLQKDFSNLPKDMKFRKINNYKYKNIQKIITKPGSIFVLTADRLDKISITKNSILNNSVKITNLAQIKKEKFKKTYFFSDIIISDNLAALATGNGIFINKNLSSKENSWQHFLLPEAAGTFNGDGPVNKLVRISNGTGTENIYALNAYIGFSQAQIYRLSLINNSISLLPDLFVKNKRTFFVNLEDYKNHIVTDGSFIGVSQSAFGDESARFFLLPHLLKSGQPFSGRNEIPIDLNLKKSKSIGNLVRVSATGSFMLYGDFGVRLNQ